MTLQTYDKQSRLKTARDYNHDLGVDKVTYSTEYAYEFAGRVMEEAAYPTDDRITAPRAHAVKTAYAQSGQAGLTRQVTRDYLADATPATPTVTRSFTYTENARGLLGKVQSMGVTDTTYTYDANGRLSSQVLSDAINGHTLGLAYDPRGREVTREYARNASGGGVSSFMQTTTYDKVGNVKSESVADQIGTGPVNHYYTYDARHRLAADGDSPTPDPVNDVTWTHDAVGNWTDSNQNGAAQTFTPNDDNEYTAVGGITHTYDARGNLTQTGSADGDHKFTYDWANPADQGRGTLRRRLGA